MGPEAIQIAIASLIVTSSGLAVATIGFAVAWIRARERAVRAEEATKRLPGTEDVSLAQLQQSIDAVALEVERMAEIGRFTSKLLVEGGTPRAVRETPRV